MTAVVGRQRSADSLILRTAARGAVLIGVAVILGIVLLQVVDDGGGGGGGTQGTTPATSDTGVTTTTQAGQGRPPGEVLVQVFNGSGLAGAARTTSNTLRSQGYKVATEGNAPERTGNVVQCKDGYDEEAQTLSTLVGTTTTVEPYAPPAGVDPPVDPTANCIVILGK